jgi:hypothetical protein
MKVVLESAIASAIFHRGGLPDELVQTLLAGAKVHIEWARRHTFKQWTRAGAVSRKRCSRLMPTPTSSKPSW